MVGDGVVLGLGVGLATFGFIVGAIIGEEEIFGEMEGLGEIEGDADAVEVATMLQSLVVND